MIAGISVKVCGLTSPEDAASAADVGADYLGFILYPKSPRFLPLAQFEARRSQWPNRPKVAVLVQPELTELGEAVRAGFDRFQIHFELATPLSQMKAWSECVGTDRLWLAPKLPEDTDLPPSLATYAGTVLLDTFHASGFGGSGRTGDWAKFRRHRKAFPGLTWVLAGGLNADNVAMALASSGANFVDVNSGVEISPGIKDPEKLAAFMAALRVPRS